MRTKRDCYVRDLFDPWEFLGPQRRRLLDRGWAGVFRDKLLDSLPADEMGRYFSEGMGRPSKDLHIALGVLVLQQLHDLTDEQAVEAVALNIAWHYALDIRHDKDMYLCERTLRNYRRKVMDLGLDEVLFKKLTDELIRSVEVDASKQRLDSTAVRSAIRNLTRLGIVVETTRKFLRELRRRLPRLYDELNPDVVRKYLERAGDGCFANTRPSESKQRLPEAGLDVYELVQQFRETDANELRGFQLLRQVFEEQYDVVDDKDCPVTVTPPGNISCDNILNPADPDASYNKHKGVGYTVQIMETFSDVEQSAEVPTKPDLITHVSVGKMTVHDQEALDPALADTDERGIKPQQLLADSHYGSNECLENGRAQGVDIVSPSMPPKGKKQGKLTLEDFELDEDGRVVRCPEGKEPAETHVANIRLQVLFAKSDCAVCPQRNRCPVASVGRRESRYQYTHDRVRQRARRLENASEQFRQRYRWRAGVEATMSRLKYQMGMATLRYRGMAMMTYASLLRALGLNIMRVAKFREAK